MYGITSVDFVVGVHTETSKEYKWTYHGPCQMLVCTVTFDYWPALPREHGNCTTRMSVNNPRKFLRAVRTSGNLQGFVRCSEGEERLVGSTVELNKEPNKIRRKSAKECHKMTIV
jgi:hypothetical protein